MKKIFTLVAATLMAVGAQAFTDIWKTSSTATSPVTLAHITATFQGTWTFGNSYASASENGQEVAFTPTAAGSLTITFGGDVATSKKLHMQDADKNGLTATLASDNTVTIGDNKNPEADIKSGDGVVYALEAGKTYTFSVSGTKWRLASLTFTDEVNTQEWNFSTWDDEGTGFANQVKNNLGLFACYQDAETQITNFGKINASNKSPYTKRFQLGGGGAALEGTGTPTQRFVYFNVTGNANVSVQMISGGSGERYLYISDGTNILSTTKAGTDLTEAVATYTGGAGVIYIYGSAAINIYDIKANNVGTTTKLDDANKPTGISSVTAAAAKKDGAVYNLAGQRVSEGYKGLVIKNGKKVVVR